MPAADAAPQNITPTAPPSVVISAWRRPPRKALRITIAVAGPGVTVTTAAMPAKRTSECIR